MESGVIIGYKFLRSREKTVWKKIHCLHWSSKAPQRSMPRGVSRGTSFYDESFALEGGFVMAFLPLRLDVKRSTCKEVVALPSSMLWRNSEKRVSLKKGAVILRNRSIIRSKDRLLVLDISNRPAKDGAWEWPKIATLGPAYPARLRCQNRTAFSLLKDWLSQHETRRLIALFGPTLAFSVSNSNCQGWSNSHQLTIQIAHGWSRIFPFTKAC